MKKMMILLAVIAIAGVTQAASVRWASNASAVTWKGTGTTTTTIGKEFYLVLDTSKAGIISAINAGTFSVATAGVLGMGTAASTKGLVNVTVSSSESINVGTSYGLDVLIFDSKAGTSYYQFSSSISQKAWDGTSDIGAQSTFAAANYNVANWTAVVPEPTSMALLAFGVAVLGLRRKMQK